MDNANPFGTYDAPYSTVSDEVSGAVVPPARSGSREVSIIVKNDGTMVSQYGPCVCGASKRAWHKICLKESK